jgi:hypothetical protein
VSIQPKSRWISVIGAAVLIAVLGFGVAVLTAIPAKARVFVGFGFGVPIGFPYYPPYPYPYYPPPPPYYPPPAPYPPPASYPPAASYHPSVAYAPAGPSITYTPRRGWTNAQGEYCREYKTTQRTGSRATERYGTACRDATGQWRIVN